MRQLRIKPKISHIWLSLVAALGVLLCGVLCSIQTVPQLESGTMRKAKPLETGKPLAVQHDGAQSLRCEVLPIPDDASAKDQGGEMPFASDATAAPSGAIQALSDPASLCVALRDALVCGRGLEISAIRARLLALGADAVPAISALLHCGAEKVEVEAVRLLAQIGAPEGLVRALGKLLTVSRDPPAYGVFLTAFADNRSPAVAQWLTATLGKTQYAETRQQMLDILYTMRGPEIVEALDQAALNPMDELHAKDSRENLAMRHNPSETEGLANLLESEDESIREAAAYGLAYIGSSDACQILADYAEAFPVYADALASVSSTYAQEELLALATSPTRSVVVRTSAVQSLASRPSQRVKTVLANAVIQEPNTIVADSMQAALNTMASNEAEQNKITSGDDEYEGELWF